MKRRVFDRAFRKRIRDKYGGKESTYSRPYVASLALDRRLSRERGKIEEWFQATPDRLKSDLLGRLRSTNSKQHFGAYYELVTREFFRMQGYSVEMSPIFGNDRPDLLLTANQVDNPTVVEVATVFDDPEWEEEERKLNMLLDRLNGIHHYFLLGITVETTPLPDGINYDALRNFIVGWFDSHDAATTENSDRIRYEKDGLSLTLSLYPKKSKYRNKKGPINATHGLPARLIDFKQLRRALANKAGKYSFVKENGYPYVVAASLYNTYADNESVVDELLGKNVLTVTHGARGEPFDHIWHRDSSGLCKHNQNTRLSGVVTIRSEVQTFYPDLLDRLVRPNPSASLARAVVRLLGKPTKVHHFSLVRNPYAAAHLEDGFMRGLPQFRKTSEDSTGITYSWVDKDSQVPFESQ